MIAAVEIGQRIGLNLARVMRASRLTQGQVAARAGLSQPTVSALVGGATKDPPIGTLLKISTALSLNLDELLADVTPQDVDETAGPSEDRVAALELTVARLSDNLALVLEQMPALVVKQKSRGTRERPA